MRYYCTPLFVCPYAIVYVSACYYMCVRMLLYVCAQRLWHPLLAREQELRKMKDDLATRSRVLAAAADSDLREQIDMNTRLKKKERVAGELEVQVKQLDLDLHTLPLPEPRRLEEIVNEVIESSLTETQEYATRVGMLWVRPEKTNHRVQRRFVLFNQVAKLLDEPATSYQLHMHYVCCSC